MRIQCHTYENNVIKWMNFFLNTTEWRKIQQCGVLWKNQHQIGFSAAMEIVAVENRPHHYLQHKINQMKNRNVPMDKNLISNAEV